MKCLDFEGITDEFMLYCPSAQSRKTGATNKRCSGCEYLNKTEISGNVMEA